jgi:NAD(P) transhydrogenase subunit alpha
LIISDFTNYPKDFFIPNTTILRLERVPRTSIAQSIDILSAQSIVRGYMAAIYALLHANRIAPQLMTAATSIKALKALVIGASTTGLQTAATLKKAGCHVTLCDISEELKELALSVGAEFALSQPKEKILSLLADKDIVISTASPNIEIITENDLKKSTKTCLYIDTTNYNLNIKNNPPYLQFYRNTNFERLAPLTASKLWAYNMLNLLTLILPTKNTLDLSIEYVLPMISINFGDKNQC